MNYKIMMQYLRENGPTKFSKIVTQFGQKPQNLSRILTNLEGRKFKRIEKGVWDIIEETNGDPRWKKGFKIFNEMFKEIVDTEIKEKDWDEILEKFLNEKNNKLLEELNDELP